MKTYRPLFMSLLAMTLCFALPSCSDDDEEKGQSEVEFQGEVELFNLKMNLCKLDNDGNPIEAAFGKAYNEAIPSERAYYTKDSSTAKRRFQSLFNSTTQCSSDGNTYTLANNLGTATFATGNGDKGLLGTATFNVPGLKGLVTKIYFIDYTQTGENGDPRDFDAIRPGTILTTTNTTHNHQIAFFPWEDEGEKLWIVCRPYIQQEYKTCHPTLTAPPNFKGRYDRPLEEYFKDLTEEEYIRIYKAIITFLDNATYAESLNGCIISTSIYPIVWDWDKKSLYIQAKLDCYVDFAKKTTTHTYSYLLLRPDNYADRTKLYVQKEGEPIPSELNGAFPVATEYGITWKNCNILIKEE